MYLYFSTANGKSFLFFSFFFFLFKNILYIARGTLISSRFILTISIALAVEYCVDVMFYHFVFADKFGCYKYSPLRESDNLKEENDEVHVAYVASFVGQ